MDRQVKTRQDKRVLFRSVIESQLFGYDKIHFFSNMEVCLSWFLLGLSSKKMSRVHLLQPLKKKPGWKPRSPVVILVEPPDFGQEVARTRLGPPPQAYLSSLAVGPLNCLSSQSWSQVEVVLSDRGLLLLLWKFWPCSATRQSKVGSYLKTGSACTVVVTSCLFY